MFLYTDILINVLKIMVISNYRTGKVTETHENKTEIANI